MTEEVVEFHLSQGCSTFRLVRVGDEAWIETEQDGYGSAEHPVTAQVRLTSMQLRELREAITDILGDAPDPEE